ncbi:hypothetical protein [Heliorestis convoluta]|nr:hypothetical protein [Heliorestis convoluta]
MKDPKEEVTKGPLCSLTGVKLHLLSLELGTFEKGKEEFSHIEADVEVLEVEEEEGRLHISGKVKVSAQVDRVFSDDHLTTDSSEEVEEKASVEASEELLSHHEEEKTLDASEKGSDSELIEAKSDENVESIGTGPESFVLLDREIPPGPKKSRREQYFELMLDPLDYETVNPLVDSSKDDDREDTEGVEESDLDESSEIELKVWHKYPYWSKGRLHVDLLIAPAVASKPCKECEIKEEVKIQGLIAPEGNEAIALAWRAQENDEGTEIVAQVVFQGKEQEPLQIVEKSIFVEGQKVFLGSPIFAQEELDGMVKGWVAIEPFHYEFNEEVADEDVEVEEGEDEQALEVQEADAKRDDDSSSDSDQSESTTNFLNNSTYEDDESADNSAYTYDDSYEDSDDDSNDSSDDRHYEEAYEAPYSGHNSDYNDYGNYSYEQSDDGLARNNMPEGEKSLEESLYPYVENYDHFSKEDPYKSPEPERWFIEKASAEKIEVLKEQESVGGAAPDIENQPIASTAHHDATDEELSLYEDASYVEEPVVEGFEADALMTEEYDILINEDFDVEEEWNVDAQALPLLHDGFESRLSITESLDGLVEENLLQPLDEELQANMETSVPDIELYRAEEEAWEMTEPEQEEQSKAYDETTEVKERASMMNYEEKKEQSEKPKVSEAAKETEQEVIEESTGSIEVEAEEKAAKEAEQEVTEESTVL